MSGHTLMVQGTSSSVGKSLLVAALSRIFVRQGVRVAPFKAQNMSNNACVCADGSEIGRSQAMQAAAARIPPSALMNPILLKPEADSRSQVIVSGRPWQTLEARAYYRQKEKLWPVVTAALDQLRRDNELVIIEGAGSPAELNLRNDDIVNMAVARYCDAPVVLVGDIDRGGVFAQLLGTLSLLEDGERRLVRGLIVNKFRGDRSLFESGASILEQRGGVSVLGVVPWIADLYLPDEDGQTLDSMSHRSAAPGQLDIAIIHLPRIANFDDFDPLAADAEVCLRFVNSLETLGHPDVVLVPGTKSTVADMKWLAESGLGKRIVELSRNGTSVVGICGGYQLLGRQIVDPDGVESSCPEIAGLGLLSHTTIFAQEKITNLVRAEIQDDRHCSGSYGHVVSGYEIHMGRTQQGKVPESEHSWLKITDRGGSPTAAFDGSVSEDGRIWGCYLHGLFANDGFRRAWLNSLKKSTPFRRRAEVAHDVIDRPTSAVEKLDAALNSLADHVEASLDMNRLNEIIWPDGRMNRV